MLVTDLSDGWTVRAVTGDVPLGVAAATVPATVPGCVHTDLLQAGLLPDPYLDLNEALVQWVGLSRLAVRDDIPGGRRAARGADGPGLRRARHGRAGGAERRPRRGDAQHAPHVPVRRRPAAAGRGRTAGRDLPLAASRPRISSRRSWAGARTSTTTRTTPSERWRATSAGTGGRTWRRSASGSPSRSSRGRSPGWRACARSTTIADGVGTVRVHVDVERAPDAEVTFRSR